MLAVIDKITPVRVSEADETAGLDEVLHGKEGYIEEFAGFIDLPRSKRA